MRVGLISDTHGLLRPQARRALVGAAHLIHAGDIGTPHVLAELATIAPVTAVRGNNDRGAWAASLPLTQRLTIGSTRIYVIHDLATLDIDPAEEGFHVVVSGHSHRPRSYEEEGVHFVNPGSAGPRRFKLPVSLGWLELGGSKVRVRLRTLDIA